MEYLKWFPWLECLQIKIKCCISEFMNLVGLFLSSLKCHTYEMVTTTTTTNTTTTTLFKLKVPYLSNGLEFNGLLRFRSTSYLVLQVEKQK